MRPLLRGERFAAECLTEPRGGSDFFGTNEIMSTIIAGEWYKERAARQASNREGDPEADAAEAGAKDEKIYS